MTDECTHPESMRIYQSTQTRDAYGRLSLTTVVSCQRDGTVLEESTRTWDLRHGSPGVVDGQPVIVFEEADRDG